MNYVPVDALYMQYICNICNQSLHSSEQEVAAKSKHSLLTINHNPQSSWGIQRIWSSAFVSYQQVGTDSGLDVI